MKLFPSNFLTFQYHEQIWPKQTVHQLMLHQCLTHYVTYIFHCNLYSYTLKGRCFTDEKIKAQKGQVTCPRLPK